MCAYGREEGGRRFNIGFGILLYKHHASLTTTRIIITTTMSTQDGSSVPEELARVIGNSPQTLAGS